MYESFKGGGLRDKIGHHKIGACAEIGQNRIRGGWGVKKIQKTSDIIYVCSLIRLNLPMDCDRMQSKIKKLDNFIVFALISCPGILLGYVD